MELKGLVLEDWVLSSMKEILSGTRVSTATLSSDVMRLGTMCRPSTEFNFKVKFSANVQMSGKYFHSLLA